MLLHSGSEAIAHSSWDELDTMGATPIPTPTPRPDSHENYVLMFHIGRLILCSALLCSAVMTLPDCARGFRSQRTLRVDTPPGKKSGEPPTTSCLTGRTQMVVPSRLNPRPWRDGRDSVPLRRPVWVGRRTCDRAGRAESTPVVITPTFDV